MHSGLEVATICKVIKKNSDTGVFLWILLNFLRTSFLRNTSGRLLLYCDIRTKNFQNVSLYPWLSRAS